MGRIYLWLFAALSMGSCMKPESPVILPVSSGDMVDQVRLGEDYEWQVYYSLEKQQAVKVSGVNSWDIAFEAGAQGDRIYLNGGKDVYAYPLGHSSFEQSLSIPNPRILEWKFDAPSGDRDSTAIGNWNRGDGNPSEVFVLRIPPHHFPDSFVKIQFLGVDAEGYRFRYGSLRGQDVHEAHIPKDPLYNYVYFSFSDQKQVYPEPPRDSWDIVFTRYRHIYYHLDDFPYLVVGALLNPHHCRAGQVPGSPRFSEVGEEHISSTPLGSERNIIGFEWKSYDIDRGIYVVDPSRIYIVETVNRQYVKLQFLDFYGSDPESGPKVKGSPRFSLARIR